MTKPKYVPLILICVLLIPACAKKSGQGVSSALSRYDSHLLNMQADSLAEMFTEDGTLGQIEGASISGRESIRDYMKSFVEIKVLENSSKETSIEFSGDSAVQKGTYTQRAVVHEDTLNVSGEFSAVWVLDKERGWILRRMLTKPAG